MALPTGTITFLLTDVEGSTGLFEKYPKIMNGVLARHEQLGIESVDRHQGCLIRARGEGDSTFSVFARASDAVAAACDFQRALRAESWPDPISLRVRMALHTGEANLRDNDYYGSSVNRCARLRAIAHGGQVLLSGATVALVRGEMPPDAGVKHLGEHRLRDLEYPEHVYQLLHPDLPDDFGHLLSLDTLPNNLPQRLTSFIGRESEITDVESLLRHTRLLTITGPGGCGKTRLALQVAADVLDGYPDGVWWVELGGVSDPAFVPHEVAAALGLREEPNIPLRETLANWLRARNVLLVLDNCEHLLDACSSLAQELLLACPRLHILASSREVMGVSGETIYRVPLLSLPDPVHLPPPADLGGYEAVQLFVARASAHRPGFAVTSKNAFAVAQVCQRLDGMPLALELAAARIRALSIDDINKRLDERGFELKDERNILPRQKTLTATMDWSYDLLTESERVLLHRLSIFRGGWTLDAAECVCADGDPAASGQTLFPAPEVSIGRWELVDLLTSLVDKSLVQYEESSDGAVYYRILETIRQYSYKRLEASGNAEALHGRHATWYLEALQRHAQRLEECSKSGQGRQAERAARECWVETVRADYMNAQAAVEWALGRGEIRTVTKFIEHLFPYWLTVGYITEGRKLYARVLQTVRANAVLRDAESPALDGTVEAILCAAQLAKYQGDFVSSRSLFQEVLALSQKSGDVHHKHEALINLGFVELGDKNFVAARTHFEESKSCDRGEWADLRYPMGLGLVARFERRYEDAREYFGEVIDALQGTPCPDLLTKAHALLNLGHVLRLSGQPECAAPTYREALEAFVQLGDHSGIAYCLDAFAALAVGAAARRFEAWEDAPPSTRSSPRGEEWACRAVRLFAAADSVRQLYEAELSPADRAERDALRDHAEGLLGTSASDLARVEGAVLSIEEAISLAMAENVADK